MYYATNFSIPRKALALVAFLSFFPVALPTAQAADTIPIKIVPEKDLLVDPMTGAGAFAWSEDSKAIAYVKWLSGHIGIINVETSEDREVPNFQMNGATALVMSQDGTLVALSSGTELIIMRVPDGQVIGYHAAFKDPPGSPRIGHAMAFVEHDTKLVVENSNTGKFLLKGRHVDGVALPNPTKDGVVLLTVYDIATKTLTPLFSSSYNEDLKREYPSANTGQFYNSGAKLFFVYVWQRERERAIDPPNVDLSKDNQRLGSETSLFVVNRPSTCNVVNLSNGLDKISVRTMDFPPPGQETLDGSRDIGTCEYSVPADRLLVTKRRPIPWDSDSRGGPWLAKWKEIYYETHGFDPASPVIAFAKPPKWISGEMVEVGVHPTKPWELFLSEPSDDGRRFMMLWDLTNGQMIGQTDEKPVGRMTKCLLSPDGRRIACQKVGYVISVYTILSRQ